MTSTGERKVTWVNSMKKISDDSRSNIHIIHFIKLHQVRHTSILFLLMNNAPIGVVAERAGHRTN